MKNKEIKRVVREGYARVAKEASSCCAPAASCCGDATLAQDTSKKTQDISKKIGYTEGDLKAVPEGANLGLGCGNPVALASLKEGEIVLDLGSGAGFDCFLAANKVGRQGKVIGVDMTSEMIEKARENAEKGGYENVEFRLGEIENLPVANSSVDVVISNCVINLSPDKRKVFLEAFRVLRPGGRLMISDMVLLKELPDFIKNSVQAYVGCLSGAMMRDEYIAAIKAAGFGEVRIIDEKSFPIELIVDDPTAKSLMEDLSISPEKAKETASSVISIKVYAKKADEAT
ncbi:arsenite methyltransferase [Candidatus Aerophobetes bacterium]|uniref:Arsenite methyltransferase n=1 Tax=Aerophobetes bacterium TaxID=2030807 RepID=A0A523QHZ4_UNCAE|nr:MAG: arsenite methyltransferase [Candidatus Aerophobetes bacterium]